MGWESFDSWSLRDFASEPNCSQHTHPGWSRIRFNDSTGRSDTIRPSPLSLYLFSSVHLSISLIKKDCEAKGREHSGTQPWCDSKKKNFRSSRGSIHTSEAWNILSNQKALDLFESQKVKNSPQIFEKLTSLPMVVEHPGSLILFQLRFSWCILSMHGELTNYI